LHRQWIVTLQDLPEAGRRWSTEVPAALLKDAGSGEVEALTGLVSDVHWDAELVCKGGVYRLCGHWQTSMLRHCSRCTDEFVWQLDGVMDRSFRVGGRDGMERPEDLTAGECDYMAPPGTVNLIDVLREDVWLAWKPDVVCSANCKGLCPQCGCNLNKATCACEQESNDHPFAALRRMKLEH
jgi:uncharacterized protein